MEIQRMLDLGLEAGLVRLTPDRIEYPTLGRSYANDPEEYVRAATYVFLVTHLQYPPNRIDLEVPPLRRDPQNPADIIVYADDRLDARFIVCEIKADSTPDDVEEAKRQGLGNSNLQGSQYLMLVCGTEEFAYDVAPQPSLRNLEDHRIATLPIAYGQAPTYRYVKGGGPEFDLRLLTLKDLTNKFERSHRSLWEGGRRDPVTAFDDMSKIMFAKVFDELNTPNGEHYQCQIGTGEGTSIVATRISERYNQARRTQPAMFIEDIGVSDDVLVEVIGNLQDVSLYHTDIDAKGRAFEQFIGRYFRGEYGQYFTPRNVVSAIVQVADLFKPLDHSSLCIDPACGSGGFLLQALAVVRDKLRTQHGDDPRTLQRLEWAFARDRLFGVEVNEKIARVAMMDMVIHDDGSSNIKRADGLDHFPEIDPAGVIRADHFDFVFTNPPFGDAVDAHAAYYNDYALGGAGEIARGKSQQIEILFIERCLDLLAEGGLLAIVLPDSAITNIECIPVCEYLLSRGTYLGALSLPQHTFNPFGSDAKTTVLFMRKTARAATSAQRRQEFLQRVEALYHDEGLSPAGQAAAHQAIRDEYADIDHPILMVHVEKVGYTAVGRPDDDYLPPAVSAFAEYCRDPDALQSQHRQSEFWFSKVRFLDLITKLDVEAYNPAYFEAIDRLRAIREGELRRLDDLCLQPAVQSGTGSAAYQEEGVPIVKTADVVKRRRPSKNTKSSASRVGFIKWDEITDLVPEPTWQRQATKQLSLGDILVQCVAHKPEYIGDKIALVDTLPGDGKALALNKFLIVRPDRGKVEPEYLVQFLASEFGRMQMARFIRGMTAQIYEQDVKSFIVYIPPEQLRGALSGRYREVAHQVRELEGRYRALLDSLDNFHLPEP